MKSPITNEEFESLFNDFITDPNKTDNYLDIKLDRYTNIAKGIVPQKDIFKWSVEDIIYELSKLELAEGINGEKLGVDVRKIYNSIWEDNPIINIKCGIFLLSFKKPFNLKEIYRVKDIVNDIKLTETDNFFKLQDKLEDNLKITRVISVGGEELATPIDRSGLEQLPYQDTIPLMFISPVIFTICVTFVDSLGAYRTPSGGQ